MLPIILISIFSIFFYLSISIKSINTFHSYVAIMKIIYNISCSVFSNEKKRIYVYFYVLQSKLPIFRTARIDSRAVHMHSPIILFRFVKKTRRILTFFIFRSRGIFREMYSIYVYRIWFLSGNALLFLLIGRFVLFFIDLCAPH